MSSVKVKLPDDRTLEVPRGTSALDVASSLRRGLKKNAVGAQLNGRLVDVNTPINSDCELVIITSDSSDGLHLLRHSTAHLLAQALKRIYGPKSVQLGVGPVIDGGFYYDVAVPNPLSSEDLPNIEKVMREIAAENLPISREVVTRDDARKIFEEVGDELKQELIRDLPETETITVYRQGEFVDLCRGPHVPSTGRIKAFKLLSVGGAYWRGDAKNKMLQRIYGTAFFNRSDLDDHLQMLEEAKKRDHRRLAKELELFMFSEDAPGMPFYLPKGLIVRNQMEQFERSLQALDYEEVRTPLIMNERLWKQSGHWDHYHENMYFVGVDQETYALKPMNCPGHMLIYSNKLRSYRDLPIRLAEYGICHRHELSGALSGLTRVRTFTQDDAHIFVRPDQIESEIAGVLAMLDQVYRVFGFTYKVELSTRPENSMGSDELWDQAESSLQNVLESRGIRYQLNEGDGAFYGPKIDFHIEDALKRSWQCGTIQLDFQLPERFDLTYVGEDNSKHRPVVIHRAIFGSMERFPGILTEHFGGAFPVWLAPVQVRVIAISDAQGDAAQQMKRALTDAGVRVEIDRRNEKLGYKIREAQLQKVPYMFLIGEKEMNSDTVAVRKHGEGDLGTLSREEAIQRILLEERLRQLPQMV